MAGAARFDEDQSGTSLFLRLDPGHGEGSAGVFGQELHLVDFAHFTGGQRAYRA